jgi:hypothetical protein
MLHGLHKTTDNHNYKWTITSERKTSRSKLKSGIMPSMKADSVKMKSESPTLCGGP